MRCASRNFSCDLKNAMRLRLWPDAEQENLIAAHDAFAVQAMVDLQIAVPCYQFGNTDFFAQWRTNTKK